MQILSPRQNAQCNLLWEAFSHGAPGCYVVAQIFVFFFFFMFKNATIIRRKSVLNI